jgi:hypothetical protein
MSDEQPNDQQQPMHTPEFFDSTITWGGNQPVTIPAGAAHDPVRQPLTTGEIVRAGTKHALRTRTWIVQLVVNCVGFDPTDNVAVSGFLQTSVGVGQAQHTILSPFSITPTTPGVYPQFFDNGVIPATTIAISATYNGGGILGSIAGDRVIEFGCFASPWDVDGDHTAQEKLESMAEMMHRELQGMRREHAHGVNLLLEALEQQPRGSLATLLTNGRRRGG